MQRFWEIILGLREGFLAREGEFSLQFNPSFPGQQVIGAGLWNALLVALAVMLVVYVYRKEGRPRGVRLLLGGVRLALLLLLIALLNRPVIHLLQSRIQPSVVAVLIDDSISMRVPDAGPDESGITRLEAVRHLLSAPDQALLEKLAEQHTVRLYRFSGDAQPLAPEQLAGDADDALRADGRRTQVVSAVRSVLEGLQGQRVAGVVVLSDGRETPAAARAETLEAVRDFGVKVFPVVVGSEQPPRNVEVVAIDVQDSAFKDDAVNLRATIRASGLPADHPLTVRLLDKKTGQPLLGLERQPVRQVIRAGEGETQEVELIFKPEEIGTLDLVVEAEPQPREIDEEDNVRYAQIEVLDAQINVLVVDGYPRWDFRYLRTEMMRDKTVNISTLLLSADPGVVQEGDRPIYRFPESIEELLDFDVVLFGDVDPRYISDAQFELIRDFVANRGGGFGMVAGPRFAPQQYRNTAVEAILPVHIGRADTTMPVSITEGFRPVLTPDGRNSSIFRFFADRQRNQRFLENEWQPLFWYQRGVTVKPGVGEVYAEHPTDVGPDGRKAPILVLGRFGAGRTMFSAIDDSWRWRFYTGEAIFDTYWIQQFRYLARSKKLGQRKLTFVASRPVYELGEQVRLNLRVLDPVMLQQLPEQIGVEVIDETGQVIRREILRRQQGQAELYTAGWTADRVGKLRVRLPQIAPGVSEIEAPIEVAIPRLELAQPQVDRTLLTRLASETMGQAVTLNEAASVLPTVIQSVAQRIPIESEEPLWDAPLALALFVLLIGAEWVLRKAFGML